MDIHSLLPFLKGESSHDKDTNSMPGITNINSGNPTSQSVLEISLLTLTTHYLSQVWPSWALLQRLLNKRQEDAHAESGNEDKGEKFMDESN